MKCHNARCNPGDLGAVFSGHEIAAPNGLAAEERQLGPLVAFTRHRYADTILRGDSETAARLRVALDTLLNGQPSS